MTDCPVSSLNSLTIDLNADAGESFGPWQMGQDAELLPLLTSVNIALGFHAGDPQTLWNTVRLARDNGLGIGGHPGYPDLLGFGRRAMSLSAAEIEAATLYQLGALQAFLQVEGAELQHVKAHGALYSRVHEDEAAGQAFCRSVKALCPQAYVLAMAGAAGDKLTSLAEGMGLQVKREAFPERAYTPEGRLAPRDWPGSSIHDPQEAAQRALHMAQGWVEATDGSRLSLGADTLCIHGDNPHAAEIAATIRAKLEGAGVTLRGWR